MTTRNQTTIAVLKFGGSVLTDANALRRVASHLHFRLQQQPVIAVVSATRGSTDTLLTLGSLAAEQTQSAILGLQQLIQRHLDLGKALLNDREQLTLTAGYRQLQLLGEESLQVLVRTPGENHATAALAGLGEKLSAQLLAALLRSSGVAADWLASEQLIRTDDNALSGTVNTEQTLRAFASLPPAYWQQSLRVVTGFCGADSQGRTTLLGRNASDYSAALVTAYAGDSLEIIGDTAGILSADPDYVPNADTVPVLALEDASLLAQCGAGVLHPRSLAPLLERRLPLQLRRLDAEPSNAASGSVIGTTIDPNYRAREQAFVACWLPPTSATLSKQTPLPLALNRWHSQTPDLAVATVFVADKQTPAQVLEQLQQRASHAGVVLHAHRLLERERVLAFTLAIADLDVFARLAHTCLYPADNDIAVAIIGASGRIGRQTLQLLRQQQATLKSDLGLRHHAGLRVVAICNSRQIHWCSQQESSADASIHALASEPDVTDPATRLVQELLAQQFSRLIVVDASASAHVAALYEPLLQAGIAVVTPNKIANADLQQRFALLQTLSRHSAAPYLYETTVAAALPVLRPLLDLQRAGDRPDRIQAVLSGTLGYVLDQVQQDVPFDHAVSEAVRLGYAEPNPLLDLGGEDVARKLLILLRTCGIALERDAIELQALVPVDQAASQPLSVFNDYWQNQVTAARAAGKRLAYVAEYADGKARVGLRQIDAESPFHRLRGTENAVIYHSQLYRDIPLTVSGPGAGVAVTSAGVFADVLSAAQALAARDTQAHLHRAAALAAAA
ncbi:hypothetical protein HPT27_12270 [Permianibacter sp. IMCC34836]|uniref:amino acid kinase family protein n=1 Tax=Permianibacter fluminis TaxID=2738515 RepID=UPI0015520309|nr:hypothetical protein [Permianibacter fluminis]NQD37803.1 hypothetical protein [Permianibacter fluminis]